MENVMQELMKRIHQLSQLQAEKAVEAIDKIIEEDDSGDDKVEACPRCGCASLAKNGKTSGKQRYKCKDCGRSFVYTTNTAIAHSQMGEAAWKQIIRDTLNGISLDKTAEMMNFSHATAFNCRHKILSALETLETIEPTIISGVCELDDTYVLENSKGKKLPEGYWRKARKHGAKASKRGISSEYISIQAGVMRNGKIYTQTVNRATPRSEDVRRALAGHIGVGTLVLCDGAKSYSALSGMCEVQRVDTNKAGEFSHINNVNAYHSFIKERYNRYRGVNTKYLNRYNSLFGKAYNSTKSLTDTIYNILCSNRKELYRPVKSLKTEAILEI
jgi:transposase-like protein